MLKLIWEPSVNLVVVPVVRTVLAELTGFTSDTDNEGDAIPEIAGRVCYQSFAKPRPGGNAAYLQRIKESGHGSVLEHANWSFILTGISRSLSHELVRHRAGFAYSQLSQRYVDSSDVAFVVPPEIEAEVRDADGLCRLHKSAAALLRWDIHEKPDSWAGLGEGVKEGLSWLRACEVALVEYKCKAEYLTEKIDREEYEKSADNVVDSMNFPHGTRYENWTPSQEQKTEFRKRARQTARSVLPNCTETKIFVTGNGRAWRHFTEQRGSKHAETEIRRLAYAIHQKLLAEAPNLFGDYQWTLDGDKDNEPPLDVETPYRKV